MKKIRRDMEHYLVEFSTEAMRSSRPVIRPLWMLDPLDPVNQVIDDEFLIGDKVKNKLQKLAKT